MEINIRLPCFVLSHTVDKLRRCITVLYSWDEHSTCNIKAANLKNFPWILSTWQLPSSVYIIQSYNNIIHLYRTIGMYLYIFWSWCGHILYIYTLYVKSISYCIRGKKCFSNTGTRKRQTNHRSHFNVSIFQVTENIDDEMKIICAVKILPDNFVNVVNSFERNTNSHTYDIPIFKKTHISILFNRKKNHLNPKSFIIHWVDCLKIFLQ